MRKLLSATAGATFCEECPQMTLAVRKEGLELIYKIRPGVFMIGNLVHLDEGRLGIFANWGSFFSRVTAPQIQLPKLEKCCPELYNVMTENDPDGIQEVNLSMGKTSECGLLISLPFSIKASVIACVTPELLDLAMKFFNKNLIIYTSLQNNSPFPDWKKGLSDVWN